MTTLEALEEKIETPVKKTISITGSEAVLEAMIAENVHTIFGYPGGAIMPIYDALYDYKDKLEAAGFKVTVEDYTKQISPELVERYCLPKGELLYMCRK